ncbi:bifunctional DedA family/phosphatase PAP2 family protein [Roseobacter sp. GAI101]|uniref:bifunctional DedA family/phosphatase PAP2 family protein n=1 Tax=Roseobacter sp. (strain GAI101) TaxID=391589 RepID=UPI000187220E|nr:bifunctional DedA family/phosphatase PAP2 family protein [Roseobacter sp. GAI101]EEB84994.1 phosphoesterase, PA-phosphatase related, putative [Roseobacter sp. GAI101]
MAFDQILPSLESLGLWSYWIIGLAAMLEAFFVTGVFVPGTLFVDAGGILVQQGAIDYFDLVWFVAIGSILGGEAGYWTGRIARRGLSTRWHLERSEYFQRAVRLFERHGGFALVIGRFLGPVSGLVPLAASVAGMDRRKFVLWNILSGFPYALGHIAFGYFLGEAASSLGPLITRLGLLAIAVLVLLAALWWGVARVIRLMPLAISILASMGRAVINHPDVQGWIQKYPRTSAFITRRFERTSFWGLTATLLLGAALYIFVIWIGTIFDFLMLDPIVLADTHIAQLVDAFWTRGLLKVSAHITSLGDWRVVLPLAIAATAGLLAWRRYDLLLGLGVALVGQLASVTLLKQIFHRPRPDLGYFLETSGSFPSDHAAVSIAFYGFIFFILWRVKILKSLPATTATVTLGFLVGLSQIYLIEHYLTDVINGWLVGALWLVIGIAVAQWRQEYRMARHPDAAPRPARMAAVALMVLLVLGAIWQIITYDHARNVTSPSAARSVWTNQPADSGTVTGSIPLRRSRSGPGQTLASAPWSSDGRARIFAFHEAGHGSKAPPAPIRTIRPASGQTIPFPTRK